jgi:hypothetical protein
MSHAGGIESLGGCMVVIFAKARFKFVEQSITLNEKGPVDKNSDFHNSSSTNKRPQESASPYRLVENALSWGAIYMLTVKTLLFHLVQV